MNAADPSTMAPAERLAEIAQILAAGFQRLRARNVKAGAKPRNRRNGLDVRAAAEAPCRGMAHTAP